MQRPAGEAVDIGVVAGNPRRQNQTQRQRAGQHAGEAAAIEARIPLRTAAVLARNGQHGQHVDAGQQHIHLRVALGHDLIRLRIGEAVGGFLRGGREVPDDRVIRRGVQPDHLEVVEPGGAGVFVAVSAHAREHRQFGLFRAGAAVQLQRQPFAVGVGQLVGIAEGILDRDGCADAAVADALGPAQAGDAIERVRLHGYGLRKACVVQAEVADGDAAAFIAVCLDAERADAFVGKPHLPAPAGGIEAVGFGKISVDQQILLREGREGG